MIVTIAITLTSILFLGFGIAFILYPAKMIQLCYITVTHPSAITEIRTFYGGLEIGIGLYLLLCFFNKWHVQALSFSIFALSFIVLARIIGIVVDGLSGNYTLYAVAIEGLFLLLNIAALLQFRKSMF